jgi:hypothetical protein
MKKILCLLALAVGASSAFSQSYVLKHEVHLKLNDADLTTSAPGGVAIAPNGDIYYATFESAGSAVVKMSGAVSAMSAGTTPTRTLFAKESSFADAVAIEAGRGYNDIEIDSSGNIYVAGTGGTNGTSVLRKLDSAGNSVWLYPKDARVQGIAKAGSNLIVTDFGALREYSDVNGTFVAGTTSIPSANQFQRALAYNPSNNDFYAGRNGSNNNDSGNVWSGGTPSTVASYSMTKPNLLTDVGVGTAFGVATQSLDFDSNNNQIITVDANDANDPSVGFEVWSVTGSGAAATATMVQSVSPSVDPLIGAYTGANGVGYRRIGGNDYVALVGTRIGGNGTIFTVQLYQLESSSAVQDWQLFD